MNARFGVTVNHLRDREFKLKQERRTEGQLVVVRAGAACDQAQSQSGPIPLPLGPLVPSTALSPNKRSPAVHVCEDKFELDGYQEPVSLLIHARFSNDRGAGPSELAGGHVSLLAVKVACRRPCGKQAGAAGADQVPDRVRDFVKRQVRDLD